MIENFIQAGILDPKDISTLEALAKSTGADIAFIDATFVLPTSKENISENYNTSRIPESSLFNINHVKNTESDLPHTLPSKQLFEQALSNLGIKNTDIIVIYGQHGMIMGPPRLWWMLKGFGHKKTLVLNGGLPAWKVSGNEISDCPPKEHKKTNYVAQDFKTNTLVTLEKMIKISESTSHTIIDARPQNRFTGETAEPRPNMRSGHIPNSVNVPCSQIINSDGKLKNTTELELLFSNVDIDINNQNQRIITTCGSGITACSLMLALHHIGFNNVAVYDGSWSEWGSQKAPTKIELS